MNNRLHSLMIEDKIKETLNTNNLISLMVSINEGCLFETKKFDLLTLKIVIGLGHITGIKLGILAPLEKKDIGVFILPFQFGKWTKAKKGGVKVFSKLSFVRKGCLREIVGAYGSVGDFYAQKVIHNFEDNLLRTLCPEYWD